MSFLKQELCCWYFDLKTGNIVAGCLNALFSMILSIILIFAVFIVEPINDSIGIKKDVDPDTAFTALYVVSLILILMFIAKIFFDLFFVYGVVTDMSGIIRVYFIMWGIFFFPYIMVFCINASSYTAGTICMEVFYICFNVYSMILCASLYHQLKNREQQAQV